MTHLNEILMMIGNCYQSLARTTLLYNSVWFFNFLALIMELLLFGVKQIPFEDKTDRNLKWLFLIL